MPNNPSDKTPEDVNDLAGLLDDALGDFNRVPKQQPKCSDDDLDDFLAPMDAEATQKAAENFEKMLKTFAEPQAFENTGNTSKPNTSAASHQFLSNLLGIDQFLNDEGVEPEVKMLTETILKDCFTKDVIFPLIKTFREIIDEYLADESVDISDEEKEALSKQKEVFDELIQSYEKSSDLPTDEEVESQNNLWVKLRDLGEVPPAIVTRFEAKLQSETGGLGGLGAMMPALGGNVAGDNSQCSIM